MLKRVKIQGYKSLVDVEVHLQPLSMLIGPNASGKSNFLDALQLLSRIATSNSLRGAFDPPYRGTPLESFTFGPNGIKDLLAQERVSFTIEVDVELSPATVDAVNSQAQELRRLKPKIIREGGKTNPSLDLSPVQERFLRYRIEIETSPKTGILHVADEKLIVLDEGEIIVSGVSLDRNAGHPLQSVLSTPPYFHLSPYVVAMCQELASWYFFYLEPRERMRIPTPVKEVRHIGLMGEEIAAFLNTLHAGDEVQFKAVEKALNMVVPSITGIDVSVNNYGEVELNLMEGQTPIPARVLSEGTLRVLGLLALSGAKDRPSLIGFEEPENGIHPRRMRLIASLLRTRAASGTQVIVTTHSPLLPDLIPHESLYVCRKRKGRTVIEPFSAWELPDVEKALDDEEEDLTISERILRGDFDA
jgi:predicted ATPase